MRMMMMTMMQSGGNNMDGSADGEHHVVVGRMEMGPEGLRLLEDNGNRILYGEKVMVEKVQEEEEEDEEDDDDGDAHSNKLANVYALQQEKLPGENGDREQRHAHEGGRGGDVVYGVRVTGNGGGGVGGGQQQQQQQLDHAYHHHDDLVEPKLAGELGNSMLRVGDYKLERPASEGDVGTTQSPHTGGKSSGRGRSSRDPAIEWSEGATTVLLQVFGEKYRALDRGNFTSKIWADIAARVNAHGMSIDGGGIGEGTPKTQEQCRIKVDNLKKRFKVEKEKKRVSGSTTSKWPFFETMEELIGANLRLMRGGGGAAGGGGDLAVYGLENGGGDGQQQQPLAIRSSLEEAVARIYYLEAPHSGEGDQTSETVPKVSPVERGKRKRALKDLEQETVNAVSLRALFDGFNIPASVIDAMVQEDVDETTLINSKDITGLIDQVRIKHRLQIKLGPAERIKQAIEEAREKKHTAQ